jgi:hypothetical protein
MDADVTCCRCMTKPVKQANLDGWIRELIFCKEIKLHVVMLELKLVFFFGCRIKDLLLFI